MAGTKRHDICIDADFFGSLRVRTAGRLIGRCGRPRAVWCWLLLVGYCVRESTGGVLDRSHVVELLTPHERNPAMIIDAMVEAELWSTLGNRIRINGDGSLYRRR